MWNRVLKLEGAIENRLKIAKFFIFRAVKGDAVAQRRLHLGIEPTSSAYWSSVPGSLQGDVSGCRRLSAGVGLLDPVSAGMVKDPGRWC